MLNKLTIGPSEKTSNAPIYTALLNPNSLSLDSGINYTDGKKNKQPQGNLSPTVEFQGYESEILKFELLLDATGVTEYINSQSSNEKKEPISVTKQLIALKKVVYNYSGTIHEPHVVVISWGTLLFHGRLSSMSVNYTLFDTSGNSLRANVNLSFTSYQTEQEKQALAKKSSPDLTHIVEFKAGDTLPQLCQKIYNNSAYYIDVGRFNHLVSVRQIAPGTRLYFPPLV